MNEHGPRTPLARPQRLSLLEGLRVTQVGVDVAAGAAGQSLLQLGADVTVIAGATAPAEGRARRAILDAGKTVVHVGFDDVKAAELIGAADVVIRDVVSGVPDIAEYLLRVEDAAAPVWVTISAFGLTGPRRLWTASELTCLAAGGILGYMRDRHTELPIVPGGTLGLRLAGYVGALAALHGLDRHAETGDPQHMDVSAQEATIATGLVLEMSHVLFRCPGEGGSSRYAVPSGFFRCREGVIFISVLEQHQWRGLRRAIDDPSLPELRDFEERRRHAVAIQTAVARWAAERSAVECEQALQACGVPCTSVNEVGELLRRAASNGRPYSADRSVPYLVSERALERHHWSRGAHRIAGLKVIDAGHVLAVPLGTAWLGAMGADVTKTEDLARLDVYRRRGPFASGVQGMNRAAYFISSNHSKGPSALYDSTSEIAGLTDALHEAEVIVHNLGTSRSQRLGLGVDDLTLEFPTALGIVSSGFGSTGTWAHYRAYGHNIHAFAGLVALTLDSQGQPADIGTPWADPLTGLLIATVAAAWACSSARGTGFVCDFSMVEAMASQLLEHAESDAPPSTGEDVFVRSGGDDRLIAVSLPGARAREHAEALLGVSLPDAGDDNRLVVARCPDGAGRLVEALQASGIAAAVVCSADDLEIDSHLRERAFFADVTTESLGSFALPGLPWRAFGESPFSIGPAPEIDEASVAVAP
jgi:crotonobetainyl-CoA:carnitine CoA-transferase CaiB-like acyl-CoA transferase